MIPVTRLNGDQITLNAELIETVETRPDTLLTLTTGNRIMVRESVEDIIERVVDYRQRINALSREEIRKLIGEERE